MSKEFPHPCTHCGLCCMAEPCPAGIEAMKLNPKTKGSCPALEWVGRESRCGLIEHPELYWRPDMVIPPREIIMKVLGSGVGCCFSGTVYQGGEPSDFAALPTEIKFALVHKIRRGDADFSHKYAV